MKEEEKKEDALSKSLETMDIDKPEEKVEDQNDSSEILFLSRCERNKISEESF